MKWIQTYQEIPNVRVGDSVKLEFVPEAPLEDVVKVSTGCGCTIANLVDGTIKVHFSAKPIPHHLGQAESYPVNMKINIFYKDGQQDILSFSTRVTRN